MGTVQKIKQMSESGELLITAQYTGSTLEKQQFFGHWRWVHLRVCKNCGASHRILGNDTRRKPELPPGGFYCHCGHVVSN